MRISRRFIQCDVFSSIPCRGNALAVVVDAEGLSDDDMAAFAAWTNLAETTFLLPATDPSADYRVRIFTPNREMPFAGHPTLGSCASWLHAGGTPMHKSVVRQECGVGIVEIRLNGDVPAFVAPPTRIATLETAIADRLLGKMGLDTTSVIASARLDNGPVWQVFELASAADVLSVNASTLRWPDEVAIGLIGAHPSGHECQYEVRMLAPSSGMSEDPITGSLNSALAHWFDKRNKLPDAMVVAQGTVIGRSGRVHVSRDAGNRDNILVGGHTHILVEGSVSL